MNTITLTSGAPRQKIGVYGRGNSCLLHVRSTSVMGTGGLVRIQYPLQASPTLSNDAHFETLEGLDALTLGKSRPISWVGPLYASLYNVSGGTPSVIIDHDTGGWR